MKLIFLKKVALVLAGASIIVLGLYACKKNFVKPQENVGSDIVITQNYDAKAMEFVKKVKHFDSQLAECRTTRSDCNMQIDSAIWNMEALFNTSYTFPEIDYLETVQQDLIFYADINDDGTVSMNTIASLYDEVTNSVREAYSNDGITDDKSLMTVVFERGDAEGGKIAIKVLVVSGRGGVNNGDTIVESGPFKQGDCWYFGEYGGSCEDPSIVNDAAEIIEDSINFYFAGTPVPVDGFRYINHSMVIWQLEGSEILRSNGISYIFNSTYSPDPSLFLNYDRLNYYFNGEKRVILDLLPRQLQEIGMLPDDPAFIQVDITGLFQNGIAYHHNKITYGSRILVPVNEIGPARDLLN